MRIEDLERLVNGPEGRGSESATLGHYARTVTFPRPPRIEERIYRAVEAADRAVSRKEIADALQLKVTPWLIEHIERLVEKGYLARLHGESKQGFLMFYYEVAR